MEQAAVCVTYIGGLWDKTGESALKNAVSGHGTAVPGCQYSVKLRKTSPSVWAVTSLKPALQLSKTLNCPHQ